MVLLLSLNSESPRYTPCKPHSLIRDTWKLNCGTTSKGQHQTSITRGLRRWFSDCCWEVCSTFVVHKDAQTSNPITRRDLVAHPLGAFLHIIYFWLASRNWQTQPRFTRLPIESALKYSLSSLLFIHSVAPQHRPPRHLSSRDNVKTQARSRNRAFPPSPHQEYRSRYNWHHLSIPQCDRGH